MSKYIPTPAYPDSMPVDISFVFADEKPAGKHGFVKAVGDELRFEDGTLARFWGVNFNGGACFPDHAYAEKVARRLAQAGCNIARLHQLDASFGTPNIFAFTKGPRVTTTRKLDPNSMDRLDYLCHCLKEEGIYLYLDMKTYRKFKTGDEVPFAGDLRNGASPYSLFNRRMIALQKEYAEQLWNHYNPYTGLYYKDDPAFCLTEIANESDLFDKRLFKKTVPCYEAEYHALYKAWLDKHGLEDTEWETRDLYEPRNETLYRFKLDAMTDYFREMRDYMRSIGVKIPITGTNWPRERPGITQSQRDMDFMDGHYYFYDWRWGEEEKCCDNVQINGNLSIMQNLAFMRLNNRPFFVSEWDVPWPNAFRAEGPIYYAAVCALQNWSGMAIHTYSYGTKMDKMNILGKEFSSATIGGTPYREGIFSTWNDPAKFGLFYHSALIVRRCDIAPAKKKIACTIADKHEIVAEAFATGLEQHRMTTVPDGENADGCDEVISGADTVAREDPNLLVADNGQMWRDLARKIGCIDTPRTKIIYGRLTSGRAHSETSQSCTNSGLLVDGKTDFGVVALSSLTDAPTEKSDNMLLTTIGRARNTDAVFDGNKLIDYGRAPILSEVIQANIRIKTDRTDLKVWGVNAEGYFVGKLRAAFEDGWMTFTVGQKFPASYYLIFSE